MSNTVISVRNLGKKYRLGATLSPDTLRDHIMHAAGRLFGRGNGQMHHAQNEDFWALKDISFDVQQGDVLGVIGPNGSGKSTLLKILTRITEPTEGEVRLKGRVASLLEVGTGFHQELTGRENVYMNGAILGMTRAEINAKFDEIVAFAGVDKFLDTPVKRYSSGMRVRLGFAVAAHLEPEILLVDEVLAVGDAAFQKKCLGKMETIAREGRTVLFVSHNMTAVKLLCSSAILLVEGRLEAGGSVSSTVLRYLEANRLGETSVWLADPGGGDKCGNAEVQLQAARLTAGGVQTERFHNGMSLRFEVLLQVNEPRHLGACAVVRREGELVFLANAYHEGHKLELDTPGLYLLSFSVAPYLLNPGFHTMGLYVADSRGAHEHYIRREELLRFQLEDDDVRRGGLFTGGWPGAVCPLLPVSVDRCNIPPVWCGQSRVPGLGAL
jgi:lipopolysaccharide transport system ATP-binding protein